MNLVLDYIWSKLDGPPPQFAQVHRVILVWVDVRLEGLLAPEAHVEPMVFFTKHWIRVRRYVAAGRVVEDIAVRRLAGP
jgi:hypothetical protein